MRKDAGVLKMNNNGYSIEVKDLTKKFGDFTAVNSINFSIKKGEIFGFLGPNGSGKTTTIRMLIGLMDPTSGAATVAGFDVAKQGEQVKKVIGYMSQKFSLYDDLTVSENIEFFAGVYQTKREMRDERREEVIKIAELFGKENTLTGELASAMKQHLALGCAMINEPQIIFLDEPTAGVDPVARRKFWHTIKMLSGRGVTVLVTTHYMDEAENCDRIALISDGIIVACDTPENLKRDRMKGILFEIETSNTMRALEILRIDPSLHEVALYGLFLHVVADNAEMAEEIRSRLEGNHIAVKRIERIAPALEDVFVSLVEEQMKLREPATKRRGSAEKV
jgi:ABC-2 type transport system ATP-binding protein